MLNIFAVCVLLCILENVEYGNAYGESHLCVEIQNCPKIYDLFKDPSQQDRAKAAVNSQRCGSRGNIPKVWCQEEWKACQIPDGLSGFCKPVEKCGPVSKIADNSTLVQANKEYLLRLKCFIGGVPYSVCCPSNEDEFTKRVIKNSLPDLSNNECGYHESFKVYGGQATELNEFPWTARLHYEGNSDNKAVKCTGSLINSQYIITAAHCADRDVYRKLGKLDRVTLGEYNIETERDCIGNTCSDPPVIAAVESVTVHPGWYTKAKRSEINDDIAVIRLAKPVKFSEFIKPICLPEKNSEIPNNQELIVTGWGKTEQEETSIVKQKANVHLSSKNVCIQKYRDGYPINVPDGAFCAEGKRGIDTCNGDSGGPIMQVDFNARGTRVLFLAGITSFGHNNPCGEGYYPGIYTYVSKYIDWIKKTMQP